VGAKLRYLHSQIRMFSCIIALWNCIFFFFMFFVFNGR
jgi:hypothetical protein